MAKFIPIVTGAAMIEAVRQAIAGRTDIKLPGDGPSDWPRHPWFVIETDSREAAEAVAEAARNFRKDSGFKRILRPSFEQLRQYQGVPISSIGWCVHEGIPTCFESDVAIEFVEIPCATGVKIEIRTRSIIDGVPSAQGHVESGVEWLDLMEI